ncbi:urease accessory protein UreF [Parasalinivibrio latis]|uniref:urease accessory protein UreF n=1 Tax=Parasalinivibrio latis TaxID=2952610 RepID=UPI0030DEC150
MTAEYRLFQLISPSLPIGAFTYSQGLEWAIEKEWVTSKESLTFWLADVLENSIASLELPLLRRYWHAVHEHDCDAVMRWNLWLYACRETSELRREEEQRGKATFTLLKHLNVAGNDALSGLCGSNQLAAFALAAVGWGISEEDICRGYLWSWMENAVMAGVKLVPLGQTAGQQLMMEMAGNLDEALRASSKVSDHEIGSFTPAQAIASCRHETQYTRLFRS